MTGNSDNQRNEQQHMELLLADLTTHERRECIGRNGLPVRLSVHTGLLTKEEGRTAMEDLFAL